MSQRPTSPYAAVGLAAQMGCLLAILAIVALVIGLGLDRVLGSKQHLLTLACLLLSIPINLFVVLRLTQVMIKRIIPPSVKPTGDSSTSKQLSGNDQDDQLD